MLGYFMQYGIVVVVDNQYMFCVIMGQQWNMGYYFMIDKFVVFGGLYYVIQCYYVIKCSVFKNDQILVIGFFMIQNVIYCKVLFKLVVQCFMLLFFFGYGLIFFLLIFVKKGCNIIVNIDCGCMVNIFIKRYQGLFDVGKQV